MTIFNQYSYVLISFAVVLVSVLLLWRYAVDRRIVVAAAVSFVALSMTGYFLLRPGASDVDSASQAQITLQNGKPTFLEFFSNYCAGCLALRPRVDLITNEIADEYNVLRIDIHTDFGRELRQSLRFTYTPEFILFDSTGQEVWRDHTIPPIEQILVLAPDLEGLAAG
jgi:thiol-disulfide isomerase/thioredoxin